MPDRETPNSWTDPPPSAELGALRDARYGARYSYLCGSHRKVFTPAECRDIASMLAKAASLRLAALSDAEAAAYLAELPGPLAEAFAAERRDALARAPGRRKEPPRLRDAE